MIIILFILWLVSLTIFDLHHDRKANKDIEELRQTLDKLEKIKSEPFNEEMPPNVRIIVLQRRLKRLVFCDLCPLYLTKDKEDTQSRFRQEK